MWKFSNGVSLKDGAQGATPAGSQDGTCVMQTTTRNDPMGAISRHFDQAEISPIELEGEEASEVKLVETVEDELLARTTSNHKIDYQDSVVSNRDYTILNARSIILFVILFLTGLTCL
jgi:hypothetical protein